MKHLLFLLVSSFLCIASQADTLKVFVSDGCSSFPNGTLAEKQLWLSCCQLHDYDYWKGGTYKQRLQSDKNLRLCVSKVGEPEIALLMLAGVRVGGTPFLPTKFRWGYGWPYPKFYAELSASEMEQVNNLTQQIKSEATRLAQ